MGLKDRNGIRSLREHSHVKITHPRHANYGETGTVVRIDMEKRKVWIALPGGRTTFAGHRSVEVIAPRTSPR